ncbi:TetR/AcrR family transcriptional regulator C-terminal domain-containing protein [Streptosporangium canum]|uniref:TetR/AcrR family transcriptional regulator C-terminal domain-containing protein n=1 Tax=Streptosporangium canum TaxID=324952 RepID=UPI003688AC71
MQTSSDSSAAPGVDGADKSARSPGRPKMPFERIVSTALEIVDAEGVDALTFRALAQWLGSSTATLYRHVDNRADLLGHVVERVFSEIEIDPDALRGADWPHACERLATGMFDAIARHPRAAPLLAETVPTGPNAMAYRELGLEILLAGGFSPAAARTLVATLGRFVIGFAVQLRDDPDHQQADARAGSTLHHADPALYPSISLTAAEATVPLAEEFALGLDLLIRGMRSFEVDGHREARL